MATEQMSVSMPPKMVRFIRAKVKAGEYADASEAIREAVRRMQEAEPSRAQPLRSNSSRKDRAAVSALPSVKMAVERGIHDLAEGRFTEYKADALRGLARRLVSNSVKKRRPHSIVRNG